MTPRRRRARKHIALREQLAAALAMLLPEAERTELREAKVAAKTVIARFQMHHIEFHALGGSDKWWNLHPMLRDLHRERSGKDATTIAHVKRVARGERVHKKVMLRKRGIGLNEPIPDNILSDGYPTSLDMRPLKRRFPQGRKLQSRPFQRPTNRD